MSLQEAKKRGTVLGKNGKDLSKINKQNKVDFVEKIKPELLRVQIECKTLLEMSRFLNEMGLETYRGGRWYAQTVKNHLSII